MKSVLLSMITKKWTQNEIDFLKNNYGNLTRDECSKIIGRTKLAIRSKAVELGIKNTKEQISRKQSEGAKKESGEFNVNEKLFIENPNEITAYLLGFIWADGHLRVEKSKTGHINYRIVIGINEEDGKYIKNLLDTTGKWAHNTQKRKIGKNIATFTCSNNILGKYLYDNDYESKSRGSADKILSKIPDNLKSYWFLGFLDGDGCIYTPFNHTTTKNNPKAKIDFSGPFDQDWTFMKKLSDNLNISYSYRQGRKTSKYNKISSFSTFCYNGRINCLKFGYYLYFNYNLNKIGFYRKFKKFLIIVEDIKKMINNPHKKDVYWKNPNSLLLDMINHFK